MGAEEQDATVHESLCYPEVFLALAKVLQGEEELLVGEVQQVAWRLRVVPAGGLQQSCEEVEVFLVGKDVGRADDRTVARAGCAVESYCLHLVIVCHLGDELVHAAGGLIGGVFRWRIGCIVQVLIRCDGLNNRLRRCLHITFLSLWCLLNDSTASLNCEFRLGKLGV